MIYTHIYEEEAASAMMDLRLENGSAVSLLEDEGKSKDRKCRVQKI